MKLESITLKNFQCFGNQPTTIRLGDFTMLIGANGAGKSAVLQALCRMFGIAPGQRGLVRSDFHTPPRKAGAAPPKAISLVIDLGISFPELIPGHPDGDGVPPCFRHMAVDREDGPPFCRIRLEGTWHATNLSDGEIEERLWWVRSNDANPQDDDKAAFSPRDRGLIHVIYVPAVRDPAREIRAASAALIGRLLNVIQWPPDTREKLSGGSADLDQLVTTTGAISTIQASLLSHWQALHDDALYAEPSLQFTVGELEDFLKRVEVTFAPAPGETKESMGRLSDGMKSLFYFALVVAVFDVQQQAGKPPAKGAAPDFDVDRLAPPALTVLAVEEPENHVAPQLLGRIMELLQTVARSPAGQGMITSHSPGILSRVDPTDVRYLRLHEAPGTRTTQVKEILLPKPKDEAYKYIKEAVRAYPELYFARLVILGEGDSEQIVLPRVLRSAGIGLDAKFISVVPLGGRHVNHLWRLLADLNIPFVTLLDLDLERNGGGWGRIRTACRQLLAIGVPRSPLLDTTNGTLTDKELATLEGDPQDIDAWIAELEKHQVFFAVPLDLDFLMLEAYPVNYQEVAVKGPNLPTDKTELAKRLTNATKAVLGTEGTDGTTYYTTAQRELFPWYSHLFLGRGKPATHVLALSTIDDKGFEQTLPPVLKRLRKRVTKLTAS